MRESNKHTPIAVCRARVTAVDPHADIFEIQTIDIMSFQSSELKLKSERELK